MRDEFKSKAHLQGPLNTPQMTFSSEDVKRGRAVIELKRMYEDIARRWQTFSELERERYGLKNIAPQLHSTTRKFVYAFSPDHFIFAALGAHRWSHATYNAHETALTRVNPWLVAGGLRKDMWFNMDHGAFEKLIPHFDEATASGDTGSGSITSWLKPFPLLWAGEGKNRIQSYQDTNAALFTLAETCEFIPAASLRLYKSVLNSSVWLLRYVGGIDDHWDQRIQRMVGLRSQKLERVVLPFPEVGVPLLQNYGVKVDAGWGVPWRITKHAQVRESKIVRSNGWS